MNLTPTEVMSILSLSQHPGISYADISAHKSGNIHIDVCSEINATLADIDTAISDIFPGMKYIGVPSVHHRVDGTVSDLYTIATGTGLKITLHMVRGMKKALRANGGPNGKHTT